MKDIRADPAYVLGVKIDALPRIPLKTSMILAISLAGFFTYYDISNYAYVSPVLKTAWGVTDSEIAAGASMTIIGYVVGAISISLFADSYGRKPALVISILVLGVGSILAASSQDMTQMKVFRLLTGIGMSSELAVSMAYIGELSPKSKRGKYTSIILVLGWLGLASSGPVSFILVQQNQVIGIEGWRIVMGIPGIAAFISLFFRLQMPESPRWLLSKDKVDRTNSILQSLGMKPLEGATTMRMPNRTGILKHYLQIFRNRNVFSRILFLEGVWFLALIPMYASFLLVVEYANQGYSLSESILINIFSSSGFLVGGILSILLADKMERKYQIGIGSVVMSTGFIMRGLLVDDYLGSIVAGLIAFAANAWLVTSLFTYTAENFPTKIRSSASGIIEGGSRAFAAIGPFIFVSLQPFGFLNMMAGLSLFSLGTAAAIMLGGKRTTGQSLEKLNNE